VIRAIVLALAALCAVGCSSPQVDFVVTTSPPRTVSIGSEGIRIPVGIAAGVEARVFYGGDSDKDANVELRTNPTGVIGADRTLDRNRFVLYGMRTGSATLEIFVDGDRVNRLAAVVTPQSVEP
jgi:hypothetical protein